MIRCAAPVVAVLALVGCGTSDELSGTQATQPAKTEREDKKAKPTTYRAAVQECLAGVLYSTRPAGNATRVETPGGGLIANIQWFSSPREADAFYAQLLVDGAVGRRAVAVFLVDADGSDQRVVADCLTP